MNIMAKTLQFFKKPIQKGNQGFALMLTILFMVIVSFFVSRNFDMISNNMKSARNLRAQSFLGKQAVSAVGMAKKLFTPPWKIPCAMVGGDRNKQRWACPVLFPDPFLCDDDDPVVIKQMMKGGKNDHWNWSDHPIPHASLRMPFFATALKEEKWTSILKNGYSSSDFATSLVIPGRLRCKKNTAGEIIQHYLDIKTLAKHKEDEYAQMASFPLTPPPPKCVLSASPSFFKNVLDSSAVNQPFYDWGDYAAKTKEIDEKICTPEGKCKNVKKTISRPPFFERYEPPNVTLVAKVYGIFGSGVNSDQTGKSAKSGNYSLNKVKIVTKKDSVPQSAPCSRVKDYDLHVPYPPWLVHYLSQPLNKLPRWARDYAGKKEAVCSTTVSFSFDSRISIAKCGAPGAVSDPSKPNNHSQANHVEPISGVNEDFGNGLSIGYDNDGNISVSDSSEE